MEILASKHRLSGRISVPGSKSHTIRALVLAALAEGKSTIKNPLPSADCLSTACAVPLIGAEVDFNFDEDGNPGKVWNVSGAGASLHIPDDVIDAGNSGSLLYFLTPVLATLDGWSIFTGDESLRKRPVAHVADALSQLGALSETAIPGHNGCPLVIKGPIHSGTVKTPGEVSSQYISGLMMAGLLLDGGIEIELSNPKETPYLTMTKVWLEKLGVPVYMSEDFKKIRVEGKIPLKSFKETVPSDWEAVAFPLVAALISDSEIIIENIDCSGTQGDDAIVEVLKSVGADIVWDKKKCTLTVKGGKKSSDGIGRLSTETQKDGILRVKMSAFPDAICALAVVACFIEGTVILEDADVCRKKETDRLKVLAEELKKAGAQIEETPDSLIIHGKSPVKKDGSVNEEFNMHGAILESYDDHRIAMSFSCMGLGLPAGEKVTVKDAECCAVSFPEFVEVMNSIGAEFETTE